MKVEALPLDKHDAENIMQAAGLYDPTGWDNPKTIAEKGDCFLIVSGLGKIALSVKKIGRKLWVYGAASNDSKSATVPGLDLLEKLALDSQCDSVSFRTSRKGLLKLAEKNGYKVTAYILEKKL